MTQLKRTLCAFLVLGASFFVRGAVDIGDRRELFVDDLLIGELNGTHLKLHQPQRLERLPSRPYGHYATMLKDGGLLRLYYRGDKVPDNHWSNGWGKWHENEVTLYAESRDGGISWKKPNLGVHDVPAFPDGNVVIDIGPDTFMVAHNFTPFIDTCPGVPSGERYKAVGGGRYHNEHWPFWNPENEREQLLAKYGAGGLKAFVSPDGIHWKLLRKEPIIREEQGYFDSQNVVFWSDAEQQYVCYLRDLRNQLRSISRCTSKDFLHWTVPVPMEADQQNEHLYTNCTQPYFRAPHIYLALPTRFGQEDTAITDILFMATRPRQTRYHRHFKEAFIRPGLGERGWNNRANYLTLGVHQTTPTHLSLFMFGGSHYRLRLDGFVSVHAGYERGEFITKPFEFSGERLEINFSTSGAGRIGIELQTPDGDRLVKSVPLYGDEIGRVVKWVKSSTLRSHAGKPVRLRFVMNEADLYSIRFH